MRPDFDQRSSVEVKLSLLKGKISKIALMFDDHDRIARTFRSLGVIVLQPNSII